MKTFVHYIPIVTTIFSIWFSIILYRHYMKRKTPYILWWFFGVVAYGAGTVTESLITLLGWKEGIFRAWYILGALLGGAPLAQGTVYLLFGKKTGNILSVFLILLIVTASVCVMMSPIDYSQVEQFRPTGKVLEWQWVRKFSPFINIYALIFLFGGALYSARKYFFQKKEKRFLGNIFIAIGALLPGIGGTFTRFGYTEVLYVTELLGLALIYAGYYTIKADKSLSVHEIQKV